MLPLPQAVRAGKVRVWLVLYLLIIGTGTVEGQSMAPQAIRPSLRITVVYNNVPCTPGLVTAWGFAAVVESGDGTVLFDTGGDGLTLLANLRHLDIVPAAIDAVVLSHPHGDHTGGLDAFLERRSNVMVYMPRSFPISFRRRVERYGARVETVQEPRCLFANFHSTGEMGSGIKEQALIINTARGPVVVTGCAHPGIVAMAGMARKYLNREIHLLMGGFHLPGLGESMVRGTVQTLRNLGIHKVAPSHCTGDVAIKMFREHWGSDFIEGGCGAIIEVP